MEPSAIDWENLRYFAALKAHKSFSAAARALGVNATTTSRRLAQLEAELDVLLFQRTADGLVPTEAAENLVDAIQIIERQVDLVRGQAAGRDARPEGRVRLALTEDFASSFLIPQLGPLRERYPGIELEIMASDRYVDLSRGEADLAVRFQYPGKGPPSDPRSTLEIKAKRLANVVFAVYASKAYVARSGRPRTALEVGGHDVILARAASAYLPGSGWMARVDGQARTALRVDGVRSISAAVLAGLGLGVLATSLARDDEEDLVHVSPPARVDEREAWLLMPGDLARVARVRIVWDYIVELGDLWGGGTAPVPRRRARRRRR
jgi:DNA-binding transcriptional LysR family regulator